MRALHTYKVPLPDGVLEVVASGKIVSSAELPTHRVADTLGSGLVASIFSWLSER